MIGTLTGTVVSPHQNPLIVDVHDVGYRVYVPQNVAQELKPNTRRTFYIYTHVREDALDLYGFMTQEELSLFELLLSVSGIGPKTALSIVGRGASEVEKAVRRSDVDFFTTIPRLGKKNAQKIIIELKTKLGSLKELDLTGQSDGETKELTDALLSMGFERREIVEAIRALGPKEKNLEQKMRRALTLLGKQR